MLWLAGWSAAAQPIKVEWGGRENGVMRLRVTGAAGPNINLEGSFDLERWFVLGSSAPSEGAAAFAVTNSEPIDVWYFRAAAGPAPVRVDVEAQLDESQSVSEILSPESGGQMAITDTSGIRYQFTVAGGQVKEPVAVRMTVITNLAGFPLEQRFRAAVHFEPEGFAFRHPAELKISFPEPVPELEMVGYAFDGGGPDWRPHPWEVSANDVVIPVSHFSGAGVTAQPFALSANYRVNQGRAWQSTRSAFRIADQEAALARRDLAEQLFKDQISKEEYGQKMRATRRLRNLSAFDLGIKPLLPAAKKDCGVGITVLERLDELEGSTGRPYGQGFDFLEFKELAPLVRCNCARAILAECESNDLGLPGQELSGRLDNLLSLIQIVTGRSDAQGCDLGTDNQIYERMDRAKCRLPWEGYVEYVRERTGVETVQTPASENRRDLREKLVYFGPLSTLKQSETEGFFGGVHESWVFVVNGRFTALRDDKSHGVVRDACWTATTDERIFGNASMLPSPMDFYLDFLSGQFLSAELSPALETPDPMMTKTTIERTTVSCSCPDRCPKGSSRTGSGADALLFRVLPDADSPLVTTAFTNGFFVLNYARKTTNSFSLPQTATERIEEIKFTAKLRRRAQ